MVKLFICILSIVAYNIGYSQKNNFPEQLKKTAIANLQNGDSLIYYQCHVDSASQELKTSSGQLIKTKNKKITITEKFILTKNDSVYTCQYYTSSISNYPNKKFPYLTLKEVANWEFEKTKSVTLNSTDLLIIATFETKTHPITHYQLNVNKSCPNQLTIKTKKDIEQFIIEGSYILSKSLKLL